MKTSFYIEESIKNQMDAYCIEEEYKRAAFIRKAIKDFVIHPSYIPKEDDQQERRTLQYITIDPELKEAVERLAATSENNVSSSAVYRYAINAYLNKVTQGDTP